MKQKLKKSLITIVIIVIGSISNHSLALSYTDIDDTNLTCKLTSSSPEYSGDIVIPEKVKFSSRGDVYYTVIGIKFNAFRGCSGLTSVTIPNSVTSIGDYAFYGCTGLTSVNIPNSVTEIGSYAFTGCTNLIKINIPSSLRILNKGLFSGCKSLEEIIIPNTVTTIYYYSGSSGLFYNCESLKRVIFEDGNANLNITNSNDGYYPEVESLFSGTQIEYIYWGRDYSGSSIFNKNPVKEIEIGCNVKTSPYIYGCNNLTQIVIPDNVLTMNSINSCENLKSIIIGNGIEETSSMGSNSNLTSVYLGNSIKNISNSCFSSCPNLTYIYLFSDNVTTLGTNAIPTTVSRIYVPDTKRYENLLNGYYTDNLITLNESTTEYNGKVPEFSYKNKVEGMNVSFNDSTTFIDAGNYNTNIDVIFSNNDWSTQIEAPCSYTITKAPVTIIANDAKRQYGEENPEFSCSYFGFKNGETDSVLITRPTIATTATINSSVGSYPIIPTNAEAKNYTFTYERGNLTITQASQTINWDQSFEKVFVGDQIELTAEATSGLAVKYSVSDESIAEIYTSNGKTYLDCMKNGEVTLKANQSGNDNYLAADRVTKTIVINKISGVNNVDSDNNALEVARYDIYGHRLNKPTKGINIVKYSDGTTRKECVK